MNRKILDVTVLCVLCIGLIVTANIEEEDAKGIYRNEENRIQEYAVTVKKDAPVAGVCRILSEYSFTTESDEKTEISKKQTPLVTTSETTENTVKNRWNITLTEDEIDLLAKIVWLESRGEPVIGQEAVVEVIFNRMTSEKYPDTLYEVLSQGNPTQFCSWKNRDGARPTEKEYSSIYEVLSGNTNILRNDTFYFSTEPLTSQLDAKIGRHSFCY